MIVRELVTRLGFQADDRAVNRYEQRMRQLRQTMLAAASASAAVATAVGKFAHETARAGDNIAKASQRLGVGTQALQELRFAAERSGVAQRTLDMALQRMVRRLSEAAQGSGEAQGAIKELGLDAQALANMAPDEAMNVLADALSGVENQTDQVRLAFKFFDSEGVSLLQMLDGGSENLRELREEFRALGGGITEEGVESAVAFTDAMTDLRIGLRSLRFMLGEQLLPTLTATTHGIIAWYKENQVLIRQRLDEAVARISGVMRTLSVVIGGALDRVEDMVDLFGGWENVAVPLSVAIGALAWRFGLFRKAIMFAGLLAALDDIRAWMEGQASLIERILGPYEEFAEKVREVQKAISDFFETLGVSEENAERLSNLALSLGGMIALTAGLRGFSAALHGLGGALAFLGGGAVAGGVGLLSRLAGVLRLGPLGGVIAGMGAKGAGDGTTSGMVESQIDPSLEPGSPEWQRERRRLQDQLLRDALPTPENAPAPGGGSVNNSRFEFNFQLPPGTPSSQAEYLRQEAEPMFRRVMEEEFSNATRQYPRAE